MIKNPAPRVPLGGGGGAEAIWKYENDSCVISTNDSPQIAARYVYVAASPTQQHILAHNL